MPILLTSEICMEEKACEALYLKQGGLQLVLPLRRLL